jgi:hypothetical protein
LEDARKIREARGEKEYSEKEILYKPYRIDPRAKNIDKIIRGFQFEREDKGEKVYVL